MLDDQSRQDEKTKLQKAKFYLDSVEQSLIFEYDLSLDDAKDVVSYPDLLFHHDLLQYLQGYTHTTEVLKVVSHCLFTADALKHVRAMKEAAGIEEARYWSAFHMNDEKRNYNLQ